MVLLQLIVLLLLTMSIITNLLELANKTRDMGWDYPPVEYKFNLITLVYQIITFILYLIIII